MVSKCTIGSIRKLTDEWLEAQDDDSDGAYVTLSMDQKFPLMFQGGGKAMVRAGPNMYLKLIVPAHSCNANRRRRGVFRMHAVRDSGWRNWGELMDHSQIIAVKPNLDTFRMAWRMLGTLGPEDDWQV